MFDFTRLFSGMGGAKPGMNAWEAGTTVSKAGNPFTFGLDGNLAGITPGGMDGLAGGLQGLGKSMDQAPPSQGAFAPPPMPEAPQEPVYQPVRHPQVAMAAPRMGTNSWIKQLLSQQG